MGFDSLRGEFLGKPSHLHCEWLSIFLLLFLFCPNQLFGQEESQWKNAQSILKDVSEVYSECRSYRDNGVVRTIFTDRIVEKYFSTFFVRPNQFRFEFRQAKFPSGIIWAQDKEVRATGIISSQRYADQPFTFYLEASAGVSSGASYIVPSLLLPKEFGGWHITYLRHSEIVDEPNEAGEDFYSIKGLGPDRDPIVLWVNKRTRLIHRIEEEHRSKNLSWKTVTLYHPQVDCEITEKMLEFEPNEENDVKKYFDKGSRNFYVLAAIGILVIVCCSGLLFFWVWVKKIRRRK